MVHMRGVGFGRRLRDISWGREGLVAPRAAGGFPDDLGRPPKLTRHHVCFWHKADQLRLFRDVGYGPSRQRLHRGPRSAITCGEDDHCGSPDLQRTPIRFYIMLKADPGNYEPSVACSVIAASRPPGTSTLGWRRSRPRVSSAKWSPDWSAVRSPIKPSKKKNHA
jgi:hypothetical protein